MSLLKDINEIKTPETDWAALELAAWKERFPKAKSTTIEEFKKEFPKHEYRRQDDVVSLKLGESKSLMQELSVTNAPPSVQTALKKVDATDAGSNDVVNKASSSDVSFSLMRNTINADGKVSGSDIANYIERAEELNDEVDTVPFGLETDDGQIVKVYVNAEQADKFEEAMKQMLGLEDDIEEAINRLTTQFDIVDVVWPTAADVENDEEVDPDADLSIDDADAFDDFASEDDYDVVGDASASSAEEEDDSQEDVADETDEEDSEDADSEDEESDDEESDEDKPKKKKKKAQPAEPADDEDKPKQESLLSTNQTLSSGDLDLEKNMTSIGSKFLARVLGESAHLLEAAAEDRDGVKDGFNIPLDSQARALAAKLRLPFAKRLIAFHYMVGVPGRYLNSEDAESSIAGASDMLRKKVAVRKAFLSLYDGLANAKGFAIPQETNESFIVRGLLETIEGTLGGKSVGFQPAEDGVMDTLVAVKNGELEDQMVSLSLLNSDKVVDYIAVKRGSRIDLEDSDTGKVVGFIRASALTEGKMSDAKRLANQDVEAIMKAKEAVKQARKSGDMKALEKAQAKLKKLTEAEQLAEAAKSKRGSFIQKLLETVLIELGLPEGLVATTGPSAVGTGIYRTAEMIEQDSTLERALRLLAVRMGIKTTDAAAQVDEGKKPVKSKSEQPVTIRGNKGMKSKPFTKTFKNQAALEKWMEKNGDDVDNLNYSYDPISESAKFNVEGILIDQFEWNLSGLKEGLDEAVDVGNDDFAQAVVELVAALGVPDNVLQLRRTQLVQALRQKKQSLRNRAQVMTMMRRTIDTISKNTVTRASDQQQDQDSDEA